MLYILHMLSQHKKKIQNAFPIKLYPRNWNSESTDFKVQRETTQNSQNPVHHNGNQ